MPSMQRLSTKPIKSAPLPNLCVVRSHRLMGVVAEHENSLPYFQHDIVEYARGYQLRAVVRPVHC